MTIPNMLTLMRIGLVPVFAIFYCLPVSWSGYAAATVFAIASITDWFDGYLARRLNQMSEFGAFLDPVADKLAVCVALVLLSFKYASFYILVPTLIIVSREIIVSALREWMAIKQVREVVSVSYLGKLKTAFQMIAVFFLFMATGPEAGAMHYLGMFSLVIAMILSVKSMCDYMIQSYRHISNEIDPNYPY